MTYAHLELLHFHTHGALQFAFILLSQLSLYFFVQGKHLAH